MLNYIRKGQIVHFIQIYNSANNKPKIKCYSLNDFQWLVEKRRAVGYGTLSITADNNVHLWAGKDGKVNYEHLKEYKESRNPKRENKLEIFTH